MLYFTIFCLFRRSFLSKNVLMLWDDDAEGGDSLRLAAGAGFVVVICGNIMTMPGLPKKPAAVNIDVDADGKITGLF